jgi:hypothetical protein
MDARTEEKPNFSRVPAEAVKELHRQGELCLQGSLHLAMAADQRATTMTGVLGAATVAVLAMLVPLLAAKPLSVPLVCAGTVTALCLFTAAMLCGWSTASGGLFVPGHDPGRLAHRAADETQLLRIALEELQARIDHNRLALEQASRRLMCARVFAMFAVPAGMAVYLFLLLGVDRFFGPAVAG